MVKRDSWLDEAFITVLTAGVGGWTADRLDEHPVSGAMLGAVIGVVLAAIVRFRYLVPLHETDATNESLVRQIDTKNDNILLLNREIEKRDDQNDINRNLVELLDKSSMLQEHMVARLSPTTPVEDPAIEASQSELIALRSQIAILRSASQARRFESDAYYGQNYRTVMPWLNQSPSERPDYLADNQLPTQPTPSKPDSEPPRPA